MERRRRRTGRCSSGEHPSTQSLTVSSDLQAHYVPGAHRAPHAGQELQTHPRLQQLSEREPTVDQLVRVEAVLGATTLSQRPSSCGRSDRPEPHAATVGDHGLVTRTADGRGLACVEIHVKTSI